MDNDLCGNEPCSCSARFEQEISRLVAERQPFALFSGFPNRWGSRTILAFEPLDRLTLYPNGKTMMGKAECECGDVAEDPFNALEEFVTHSRRRLQHGRGLIALCLGYDLKNFIEVLPPPKSSEISIPMIQAVCFHNTLRWNARLSDIWQNYGAESRQDFFASSFEAVTPKWHYIDSVKQALEYIYAGDIYQVNIAQRYFFDFQGSPWTLFQRLYRTNPARFSVFLSTPEFNLAVSSPERLLRTAGRQLESRPIKGTRPRGTDRATDREQLRQLLESEKEQAELTMITDLHRNDLGKVSKYGSVSVCHKRHPHRMPNVFHTESIIRSEMRPEVTLSGLLKAMLPGGSVTGCPKIRAMEIIEELEPVARQLYTGAIGLMEWDGNLDLAMTIRAITFDGPSARGWFDVGSGIVSDSNPRDEYDETLHKADSIAKALGMK